MKKKASKILLTVLTLTAISIPTYASNQMPTKFNATTIQDIRNVEEEMQQVMQICNEMDTPKNILLVDNGYVVGEVHTDGYVISYDYEDGHLATMIDNEGNKVEYEHNANQIIKRTFFNNQELSSAVKISNLNEEENVSTHATATSTNYVINGKNMCKLMEDNEFTAQSLTQAEIQNLFEERGSILRNEIAIYYLEDGEPVTYGEGFQASRTIYNVAKDYNVNPKVILCTMQKESSIITNKNLHANMRGVYYCMGYGATDSGDIERYTGIDIQISEGTSRLKELYNETNWNATLTVNGGESFTYKGTTYPAKITPANRATHALYRWTPWVIDTSYLPTLGGGNYLFLQVKETFWDTWE